MFKTGLKNVLLSLNRKDIKETPQLLEKVIYVHTKHLYIARHFNNNVYVYFNILILWQVYYTRTNTAIHV